MKGKALDPSAPSRPGEILELDVMRQRPGMIQREQNTGMVASVPRMESAHGAVPGVVEELAVTGQGVRKGPVAGTPAHLTPSQTVLDAQAGEAGWFEKIADGAKKAQLDFARGTPR